MAANVKFQAESVEVAAEFVAKVSRIADLNDAIRAAEAEAKALKAEVVDAVGGADMVALFPEGVRIAHEGVALASVKSQSRASVKADALRDAVEGLLAAFPAVSESHPEFAAAIAGLPDAVTNVTTFPVVRTK
jgi:1-acyl-sn-glycerol-3-phosphate acyltransferase